MSPTMGAKGWIGLVLLAIAVTVWQIFPHMEWYWNMALWAFVLIFPVELFRVDAIERSRRGRH